MIVLSGGGFLDGEPVLFCTKVSGFRLAAAKIGFVNFSHYSILPGLNKFYKAVF